MCIRAACRWLAGNWRSAFRVKSPRYHVMGEEEIEAPYTSTWELINAALPASLLMGVLVVGGQVAAYVCGPAVILASFIAGVSVFLTAICYAEFRARWPRVSGSPYEYTYLSIGEGVAFLLGIVHFLQLVAMAAAGGRAASQNLDIMLCNRIVNKTKLHIGTISAFGSVPDPVGGAFLIIITIAVTTGVKRMQQKVVTFFANCVTALLILFCAILGVFHMRFDLWHTPENFFPTGYSGVIEGAATFIYAFSTFEIIASKCDFNRQTAGRTSTLAFILTATSSVLLCMALPAMLTLLAPTSTLTTESPYAESFSHAGVAWMKYVMCIPSTILFFVYTWIMLWKCHDLLESFSLDALICSQFSSINDHTNTALVSAVFSGAMATLFAVLFNLTNLIQLASLCCLLVSMVTCMAAVCIRYRPSILVHSPTHTTRKDRVERKKQRKQNCNANHSDSPPGLPGSTGTGGGGYGSVTADNNFSDCALLTLETDDEEDNFITSEMYSSNVTNSGPHLGGVSNEVNNDSDTDIDEAVEEYKETLRIAAFTSCTLGTNSDTPTDMSARRAAWTIAAFITWLFFLLLITTHGVNAIKSGNIVIIILLVIFLILCIITLVVLLQYPQDPVSVHDLKLAFPSSPWLPLVAIILQLHLALHLSVLAWIQFLLSIVIGAGLYLGYGVRNSRASHFYEFLPEEETVLLPEPPLPKKEYRMINRSADLSAPTLSISPTTSSMGSPRRTSSQLLTDNIEAFLTG